MKRLTTDLPGFFILALARGASAQDIPRNVDGLGVSRLNRWFMLFVFRHMLIKRACPLEQFRRMRSTPAGINCK
jgi:hypothetical protein